MQRVMCKSKIHRATVTGAELDYKGSLSIDAELLGAADIRDFERVQVVNLNNGVRLETYVIAGAPGSGDVVLNGAAARCGEPGDHVIIMSYAAFEEAELDGYEPRRVFVDRANRIVPGPDAAPGPDGTARIRQV